MRSPFSAITSYAPHRQHASSACSKIEDFLGPDHDRPNSPSPTIQDPAHQDWRLGIKDATFVWPEQTRIVTDEVLHARSFDEERKFALVDVSIMFPAGRLSVITGMNTWLAPCVSDDTEFQKARLVRGRLHCCVP